MSCSCVGSPALFSAIRRIEESKKLITDLDRNTAPAIELDKSEKGRQVRTDLKTAAEGVGRKVKVQKTKEGYGLYLVETRGSIEKRVEILS